MFILHLQTIFLYNEHFFALRALDLHTDPFILNLQFCIAMRTFCDKLCHDFILSCCFLNKKRGTFRRSAHSCVYDDAAKNTYRNVPCFIHGHTDSKYFLQSSIYEVVIQEWTFTISLPNFLFSYSFLFIPQLFTGNAICTPLCYKLLCRTAKCKMKNVKISKMAFGGFSAGTGFETGFKSWRLTGGETGNLCFGLL